MIKTDELEDLDTEESFVLENKKYAVCKTLTNIVKGDRILCDVFCPRLIYSYGCKTSGMESAIRIIDKKAYQDKSLLCHVYSYSGHM